MLPCPALSYAADRQKSVMPSRAPHRTSKSERVPFALLAGGLLLLVGCRADPGETSEFPRTETLILGGQGYTNPSSFNPLLSSPDWPVGSNLVYETLFDYDVQGGELKPALAQSYSVSADAITVELDRAAHWNDGTPLTACDVSYTFELGRQYRSIPVAPTWQYITRVELPDAPAGACDHPPASTREDLRKVVFVLEPARRNPLVVLDALTTTKIVPRHKFEPALRSVGGDIGKFNQFKFDQDPVASGPYRLLSYSAEKTVLVRHDDYWANQARHGGQRPAPKYIIAPIYKSNDHFSIGLQQGRIDLAASFVPRIWLKARKGVHAWYDRVPYFPPSSITMLYVNVLRRPLDDVHLRRAMAYAINYADVAELAVSGYSLPLRPGLILPFGIEAKYYSEADAQKYGTRFDPEMAKAELRAGGYASEWGANGELLGMRDSAGRKVPTLFIKSAAGWTDWESIVRIAVRSMRAVGIDVRERFVDTSLFFAAWYTADFDLMIQTPVPPPQPSKPWTRLESVLTSREWAPEGEKMFKNQGRFNRPGSPGYLPRIDELLALIPTLTDEPARAAAYRELNRIYLELQPTIPIVYRPFAFYEYSTRNWQGFPSADHPYLPPQIAGDGLGTQMLWQLARTSGQ